MSDEAVSDTFAAIVLDDDFEGIVSDLVEFHAEHGDAMIDFVVHELRDDPPRLPGCLDRALSIFEDAARRARACRPS